MEILGVNDKEVKSEILQFINENSGQYYEVGLQCNFTQYPAGYLRMILRQLEEEHKITNNSGLSPYRIVKQWAILIGYISWKFLLITQSILQNLQQQHTTTIRYQRKLSGYFCPTPPKCILRNEKYKISNIYIPMFLGVFCCSAIIMAPDSFSSL